MTSLDFSIKKIVLFRVLFITIILGSAATIYHGSGLSSEALSILFVISIILILCFIYIAADSFFTRYPQIFKFSIIFIDIALASYLIHITGGRTSPLVFLYPLIVIFSSILVSRIASYVTAAGCAIFYIIIIFLQINQEFPELNFVDIWKSNFFWSEKGIISSYFHLTGFLIIAMLSGYLAEKIFEARRELGESKKSLSILQNIHENILQSLTSGVITLDKTGNIISVNRSGLNILGFNDESFVIGRDFSHILKGISLQDLVQKKRDHINYTSPKFKDLILGFSASLLMDNDGDQIGYTIVFQDLTEIKNLEERIKVTEKLAVLGQLAAGLAHEVRNPLSTISGTIQMLNNNQTLEESEKRLISVADREIEKLNLLIEDFLLLTTPLDSFISNKVDLGFIVDETIESFSSMVKRNNLKIESFIEPGTIINCDSFKLKQVFWNLLQNSMDSMPTGGRIDLKATKNNGNVEIIFADDGSGINKDNISKVFQPFYTTKEVGTGLGLAIVQKVVEGYNGNVDITSSEGEGTTIFITLPSV